MHGTTVAQDADSKYATDLVKPGTVAPAIRMKTPDGKTLQLKQFREQYVLLDFWASWCPDQGMPDVLRIYPLTGKRVVSFVVKENSY